MKKKKWRYLYDFGSRGKPRFYLWAGKGHKKYRVDPTDPNFRSIYGAFLKGEPPDPPKSNPSEILKPVVHTFGWGTRQFYKAHPFINWIDSYRADFRYNVDSCLEEMSTWKSPS